MRSSTRLLANVAKYLEANTPTGLTGLTTHPTPRPALIYTYQQTLKKLQQIPKESVYRKSVENLTKHRLAIVEKEVPEGFEAYKARLLQQIEASPEAYGKLKQEDGSYSHEWISIQKAVSWDGEVTRKSANSMISGGLADAEAKAKAAQAEAALVEKEEREGALPTVDDLEAEPPLTAQQIESIENQIGAGLIEEVITVAENELELVDTMLKAKPWEPLEEQSPPGQWSYFERGDRV